MLYLLGEVGLSEVKNQIGSRRPVTIDSEEAGLVPVALAEAASPIVVVDSKETGLAPVVLDEASCVAVDLEEATRAPTVLDEASCDAVNVEEATRAPTVLDDTLLVAVDMEDVTPRHVVAVDMEEPGPSCVAVDMEEPAPSLSQFAVALEEAIPVIMSVAEEDPMVDVSLCHTGMDLDMEFSSPSDAGDVVMKSPADAADKRLQVKPSPDQRQLHRAYTETADLIKYWLGKLKPEYHGEFITKSLDTAGASNLVTTTPIKKPRGIRRTSHYVINWIWKYWKDNATVSNMSTSRPATLPVATFEKDPLLSRVNIANENFVKHTMQRGATRYEHSYMVQSDMDLVIFKNFIAQHSLTIGRSTFRKLKPFYIRHCKEGDIESCCCIYHVNFRNGVEALSKFFKDCFQGNAMSNDEVDQVLKILDKYKVFKAHLLQSCQKAKYGVLSVACESGEADTGKIFSISWSRRSTSC